MVELIAQCNIAPCNEILLRQKFAYPTILYSMFNNIPVTQLLINSREYNTYSVENALLTRSTQLKADITLFGASCH